MSAPWARILRISVRCLNLCLVRFPIGVSKSGQSATGPFPATPAVSTIHVSTSVGISNLLMVGPPGAGKSLMASCLPGILPDLTTEEVLETSMVQSVAGMLQDGRISRARPFRSPHHSASIAALTGGGVKSLGKRDSAPHRARFSFRVTGGKLNKFRKAITYRACALRPTFFCQPSIPRIFG